MVKDVQVSQRVMKLKIWAITKITKKKSLTRRDRDSTRPLIVEYTQWCNKRQERSTLQNITLSWQLKINKTSIKKGRNILTTDQSHWRCFDKQESATRKWFHIYLNGTMVNNHKGNYIFKKYNIDGSKSWGTSRQQNYI